MSDMKLLRSVLYLHHRLERASRSFDLSISQYRMLYFLSHGPRRAAELAMESSIRKPSITSLLNTLESRGWISREEDPGDRRAICIRITDDGISIMREFEKYLQESLEEFLGPDVLDRYEVHVADSYEGVDADHGPFDRAVLDLPEPWQVVPHLESVLAPGGVCVAYTPSITQAMQVSEQFKGRWIDVRTLEVLHRGWKVDGQAVRPDHRMVAHTAFLTVARFLGQGNRAMRTDRKVERVR